jgi:hypothetical protein
LLSPSPLLGLPDLPDLLLEDTAVGKVMFNGVVDGAPPLLVTPGVKPLPFRLLGAIILTVSGGHRS